MKNKMTIINNSFTKIKNVIDEARSRVYKNINFEMVQAYYFIGQIINELLIEFNEEKSQNEVLQSISEKLTKEYGNGFKRSNLLNMKKFYNVFSTGHALRDQLS